MSDDGNAEGGHTDEYGFHPPISKTLGPPCVELRGVSQHYELQGTSETVPALTGVNLHRDSEFYPIRRGEFVMIRGPSGGGKTSLLNIIGTIDRPTAGEVSLLGKPLRFASVSDDYLARLRLRRVGFVFQTFNLLATLSAYENVELPMAILGELPKEEIDRRVKYLLSVVGLEDRMMHLPSELSGGEQQRVTIARALSNEPELLLLDEPTGDLDTRNTVEVMNLLMAINKEQGITMVMVTHNPDLESYADRILYVADGKFESQAVNHEQQALDLEKYLTHLHKEDSSTNALLLEAAQRRLRMENEEDMEGDSQGAAVK